MLKVKKIFSAFVSAAMVANALMTMPFSAFADEKTSHIYTYDGYEISYDVTNSWGNTEVVSVTISNTSDSTIENWMLYFEPNGQVNNVVNAKEAQTSTGTSYFRNSGYNANVNPNSSITFSYMIDDCETVPDYFTLCQTRAEKESGYQVSAADTISGIVIQNEWEYELKDDIMTWTFLRDDSDIVMTIEDGVCNVDGNIISINIFDWNEPDNSESNFVFDWMNKNPIKEINFSDNVTEIDTLWFSTWYFYNATKISFGENIQSISHSAFASSEVQSIILPESLQQIGLDAFRWCYNLNDVTVLSKNIVLENSGMGYGDNDERLDNMIIRGYQNSTAEVYANQNGFTFVALDEPITIIGDANEDGKLAASDAAFIVRKLAEASVSRSKITVEDYPAMDFNQDGQITAKDAADIARYLAEQSIT